MALANRIDNEQVLVFDRKLLEDIGIFQGYTLEVEKYLPKIFDENNCRFVSRSDAERDESLKQIISYVILRFDDKIFHYIRGKETGESRLVAKGSIGIGGHVLSSDGLLLSSDWEFYLRSVAAREVQEEVEVSADRREKIVALTNDESNSVGRVHFGIVHIWDFDEPRIKNRERKITKSGFIPINELLNIRDSLETWSQICLDILRDPKISKTVIGAQHVKW